MLFSLFAASSAALACAPVAPHLLSAEAGLALRQNPTLALVEELPISLPRWWLFDKPQSIAIPDLHSSATGEASATQAQGPRFEPQSARRKKRGRSISQTSAYSGAQVGEPGRYRTIGVGLVTNALHGYAIRCCVAAHLRQAGVMRDAPRVRRYRRGAPPEDYNFGMIRPITANRDPIR